MLFSNIVGNPVAKKVLARMALEKKVPQTLLFAGPEGVGKALFAKEFAGILMGEGHAGKIARGSHPDFHFYKPEGKSQLHPIEKMRSLIDEVHLPPFEAPCKVFVIDEAHRMLPTSSNALLKTFEEPAPNTTIILVSSEPESLLPTILSRCCKLSFFGLSDDEITSYLQTTMKKSPEEAKRIAFLSQGSLGKAQAIAIKEEKENKLLIALLQAHRDPFRREQALAALEASLPQDSEEDEEHALWQKEVDLLFEGILYWYRDQHLIAQGGDPRSLFYPADVLPQAATPPSLEKIARGIEECRHALQHHIKLKTALEAFLLRL